ncbi:MAG: right-handed parallel beta-helix repeat-containing protein [Actinobacteria bacterium]|nr:right-handed parallel beta-helix repeat-containing protein [Actinomycetota bacterium]
MTKLKLLFGILIAALALTVPAASALAAPPANGFTAKIVAFSGETISGNVDATGYDLGIYVGPGVHNVLIKGVKVSGANNEGILVQDAANIVIENSTISNNAVNAYPGLDEIKAIGLAGSTNVLVRNNIVEDNMHGGIGVYDDGPNSPFAAVAIDKTPVAGADNVINGNIVRRNANDCGIVIAAKNPDGGVYDNLVLKNTVTGGWSGTPGSSLPYVGGIIVAGGAAGPVNVTNTIVLHNVVTGGLIPGIALHAFGPGNITGTKLIGNLLSDNGAGELSKNTTGIEMFAVPHVGVISGTKILSDKISNDFYGVWQDNATGTQIAHLITHNVTNPVVTLP